MPNNLMHHENTRAQSQDLNLGLAIAECHARPGVPMSHRQIAAFCDCHWNAIWEIEHRALKRLRQRQRIKALTS